VIQSREPQTLHEMLRILDVASSLRRERERAAAELDHTEARVGLRERLRAAAAAAGDPVTDAEIDAAIAHYDAGRHRFVAPPRGWRLLLAHLWVRRLQVALVLAVVVVGLGLGRALWWGPDAPWSGPRRAAARAEAVAERLERAVAAAEAVATTEDARAAVQGLRAEADALAARDPAEPAAVGALVERAEQLRQELEEEFELRIVSRPGERSGIDAYYEDESGRRVSGHYLIVEAVAPDGRLLDRPIRDAEQGDTRLVRRWAEQVPQAVYERIARDKQADGIVDEAVFAQKRRGALGLAVLLPGEDGSTPLRRGRQITRNL
jgi:hypothetical protein